MKRMKLVPVKLPYIVEYNNKRRVVIELIDGEYRCIVDGVLWGEDPFCSKYRSFEDCLSRAFQLLLAEVDTQKMFANKYWNIKKVLEDTIK